MERIYKLNKIFETIKNFEKLFPDEFEKCGIKRCGHCGGTGIKDKTNLDHCTYCGGIGYIGFIKIDGNFVCRTCNGYGCDVCHYDGIVDWITHATGHDMIGNKKYI